MSTREWNALTGSLPFLAVLIGIMAGATVSWYNQLYYNRAIKGNNFKPVPEARLPPMMIASFVLAGGLLIMGWTSSPEVPWIATLIGVLMMGFGYYTIFTSAVSYLVDTFQQWSASSLAANTFARSVLAAILPLLVKPWYKSMGNGWVFTVLGVFATLNIPIPFVFWYYGPRIRAIGRFTSKMG